MATRASGMSDVISIGDDDFQSIVERRGLVLVEFYTEWWGSCQRMRRILGRIAADGDAAKRTVNIQEHLASAIPFGGQRAPTFILFVDGKPVKQLRGPRDEQTLRELLVEDSEEHVDTESS